MVSAFPNGLLTSNEDLHPNRHSALVMRNVSVLGFPTSIRLEPQIWDSVAEICRREFCTLHDVCSYVAVRKSPHSSLTSSLRIFILDYFRASATEDGHRSAGHGQRLFLAVQQERREMRAMHAERPDGSNRDPVGIKVGPDTV
jgi:predicted DNA-binding ribbon-helix-helix protein